MSESPINEVSFQNDRDEMSEEGDNNMDYSGVMQDEDERLV
jgi:hypothetical protein